MKNQLNKLTIPVSLLAALFGQSFFLAGPAFADTLKGGVNQDDVMKGQGPSLRRDDMGRGADPFANGGGEEKKGDDMLQAPPGAFDQSNVFEGKPFAMQAESEGGGNFNGQQGNPQAEMDGGKPMDFGRGPGNNPMRANTTTPNDDPEKTGEMKLMWDEWHKRVAETIYTRFSSAAGMLFKRQACACQVSYMVARDGRIGNVRVLQSSGNPIFNTMLIGIVKSIAGNPVLEYPPNSKRQFVEKTGNFTWNYTGSQGYRYTTGDQERVKGH